VLNSTRTRQRGQGASVNLHAQRGGHVFDAGASYDGSRVRFAQFEQEAWFTRQREVLADPDSVRRETSSVTGAAHASGLYAAGIWKLAPASHLSASARFNRARVGSTLATEDGPQAPEAFTYTKLNPALGITQQAGAVTWFANIAQGNRVPTVIELGCADPAAPCRLPVGLQSDPYLKQVVARTTEAGARGHWNTLEAELSLYRTVNRDDILFVGSGATRAGYFANFPRTVHQGVGLGLGARVGNARWRIDYSYLHATYDAEGRLFMGARTVQVRPGTPVAGLPRHTFKLGVDLEAAPGLNLGADMQAVSALAAQGNEDGLARDAQDDAPPLGADWSVRGYALLNLRASWRLAPGWELFARASNVLDRRYETYAAVATDMFPRGQLLRPHAAAVQPAPARFVAPGAPRLLAAGLRVRF
jgi:outer membrane receptor protein involved in Fe transport